MANYTLLQHLDAGGMGRVDLAQCAETSDLVVVKRPLDRENGSHVAAIRNEAKRLKRAQGPGVIRLLDYNPLYPFLVLEYCPDGTLAHWLRRRSRVVEPTRALRICARIADHLAELHTKLVHRDIKPANILILDGSVRIADFGLGRTVDRPTVLQTMGAMGTPEYAAPEQLGYSRGVDGRADVYSLGVILIEMLTDIRHSFLLGAYPGALATVVPRQLVEGLARMVARDRAYRPTARAAASYLRTWADLLSASAA